jgi:phage tail-like protein
MSKLPKQTKLPAISADTPSSFLDYLPVIYREKFLGQYLSAFEKILLGRNDETPPEPHLNGLEETIDAIALYFDPNRTPQEFLSWLAGWAALSLRADLDEATQRSFIAQIIQLYRRRGTKDNLIQLLTIFTGIKPTIDENAKPRGVKAPGDSPYFFKVSILMASPQPDEVNRQRAIARALIEMEKPAYTYYELDMNFVGIRLGDYAEHDNPGYHATIGKDTFIGIVPNPPTVALRPALTAIKQ